MWPAVVKTTLALLATLALAESLRGQQTPPQVDFLRDVPPVLASHCFECHGPDESSRQAELRLDRIDLIDNPHAQLIRPGDAQSSELFERISSPGDQRMPPAEFDRPLTDEQVELIRRWIDSGASSQPHWSLIAPHKPTVPSGPGVRHPIDGFVRAELARQALQPSPVADKRSLIRRVTLDLTGLPPTPQEIDRFLADTSPAAYQRLVDRLLASPRYGEHMAVPWLDAARFADTHGYLFDTERAMWRWRDWVIDALNQNQPFDEFTVEQLAGDLLDNPTESQRIATGFNRNHLINNEAGANAAEYLVENVIDRVNTTSTVWMGLSLACCQCHDHKYDPFSQREYYQLYAFFNTLPEVGLDGLNSNAKPTMQAPTARDAIDLERLRRQFRQAEQKLSSLSSQIDAGQHTWEATLDPNADVPVEGLIAHWPLDQSSTDLLHSDQPTAFEAAPASYAGGILGQAASLEGLGYLNAGDRFNFSASDSFSIAAWVRPSTDSGRLSIISRMENAKQLFRGYTLQTFGGIPSFFLLHRFPDNMIQVQAMQKLDPDQWHHVALTYDGSGKAAGVKLYVNGTRQQPTQVVDKLTEPITTEQPFWLGNGHPGAKLKGLLDEVRIYDRVLSEDEIGRLPGLSIDSLLSIPLGDRNEEQSLRVRKYYLSNHAPAAWRDASESVLELKASITQRQRTVPNVMVMQEAKQTRETFVLRRGAYNMPADKVSPATPAILPPMNQQWPRNRLGLAKWLVAPEHPLTARVTVNRYWQMYFGTGLVRTAGDFGVQGEPPSHPDLLDWLAREFVDRGWDVKAMQRLIVTSSTYRQSSRVTPELLAADPGNRALARGPRKRLSAEMIRDQALAASGLLVSTIGGPSVRPYQPAGLWREVAFDFSGANLTAQIYQPDSGADLYRRSMYTFWKRTAPPPSMVLFDAPDRERCVVRRNETNTPMQALLLMNDPTYIESARLLASRVLRECDGDPPERITHAFRLLTSRRPQALELDALVSLFEQQHQRFADHPQLATELLSVGNLPIDQTHRPAELAAFTLVANVVMTLDETIAPR